MPGRWSTYTSAVIDTEEKLAAFLASFGSATWVAVDTEADSLHAYPEKVCLIQLSTHLGDRIVDPLAGMSLDPLLDALATHELVMHGADYDLRLLRKHHDFVPKAVFDTMLASRLLGARQFSLSYLVHTYLGVKLEKGAQKANWAVRPLAERLVRYARNDTRYLKPLADRLQEGLRTKGRLEWHQEYCARLIADSTRARPSDAELVWRVKGSHLLGRPSLAVLRELWHWREVEAVAANKPPFFVLSHEMLVKLASTATSKPIEPLLPRSLSERRRASLRKAIARGLALDPDRHPRILESRSRRPSDAERRRFADLQRRRDAQAAKLDIDPTLIASRSLLSDLAHDWERHAPSLMNWQHELLA